MADQPPYQQPPQAPQTTAPPQAPPPPLPPYSPPQPAPPAPQYNPQMQSFAPNQPKPFKLPELLVGNKAMLAFILAGVLFVAIGGVLVHTAPSITNYGNDAPDDDKVVKKDIQTQNSMTYTGNALADLGAGLLASILIMASMFRKELSDNARFGMLFAAGFIMLMLGLRI